MVSKSNYLVSYVLWFNKFSVEKWRKGEFLLASPNTEYLNMENILPEIARRESGIKKAEYGIYSAVSLTGGKVAQGLVAFSKPQIDACTGEIPSFEELAEIQAELNGTSANAPLALGSRQALNAEALEGFMEGKLLPDRVERSQTERWSFNLDGGQTTDFKIRTKARRKQ